MVGVLILTAMLVIGMTPIHSWKWRTYGGVYGSRGIAMVALWRLTDDPSNAGGLAEVKGVLSAKWELIRTGSVKPDAWRRSPYYLDLRHTMTYVENQAWEWLLKARDSWNAGARDNAVYFLGIAAHYLSDVMKYTSHDNFVSYYENLFGDPDLAYSVYGPIEDHLEAQVEFYRPKDPALIVDDTGSPYSSLENFIAGARSHIRTFIDRVMPPDDPMGGWLGEWIENRKCESTDYSEYTGNPGANVAYGSKELVDMATELVYSGWVYALGIQNGVSADRITWTQWWDRSHREPGVWFVPYSG